MAKLRRNHTNRKGKSSFSFFRVIVFLIFLVFIMYFLYQSTIGKSAYGDALEVPLSNTKLDVEDTDFYPCGSEGQIVEHKFYSLSYNESAEQADWVAYRLTKKSILVPNVKRSKWFDPDYSVTTGSAFHKDYRGSGYSRGHLAPAGDMAFSTEAMKESFLMSNMSPQLRAFNGGIWNELEQNVRDWAVDNNEVIVVTGPLLNRKVIKSIGHNNVKVPSAFYKIILDNTGTHKKAIAFIIPNELSNAPLSEYVVSIDEIEKETGFDFFCEYLSEKDEISLESHSDTNKWRFNNKRFNLRVKKWNLQ